MKAVLDHVFICCSVGAPEAGALARLGLREGTSNTHPGQGTACRRFFFENAYLELLWVSDPNEAQCEAVRRTRLWDRWSNRGRTACPFGVVLRPPAEPRDLAPPFPTWAYHPSYMPPEVVIEIALDTPLSEPELFYLGFQRGRARFEQEPMAHGMPATEITDVGIGIPVPGPRSVAVAAAQAMGLIRIHEAEQYVLELTFDQAMHGATADLRPDLPLILRW